VEIFSFQTGSSYKDRIDTRLSDYIGQPQNQHQIPDRLQLAIEYGINNGGKRIRPLLIYMITKALGADISNADNTACAVELIHCYSLIHDDLPAMDDDDFRRGNPTVHIQFDEATAILAADAMQSMAYELIASDGSLTAEKRITLVSLLANASGPRGMIAGQMIDMDAETRSLTPPELENMHRRKTGDLIAFCTSAGAIIGSANAETTECLKQYGYALGLAFQVKDDILDVVGNSRVMGKPQGSDIGRDKTTFVSSYGLNSAIAQLEDLKSIAVSSLEPLGDACAELIALAEFVVSRDH
jgi:geranylgeranyl pyrophosphate synthase